jgi:hypothetical protein
MGAALLANLMKDKDEVHFQFFGEVKPGISGILGVQARVGRKRTGTVPGQDEPQLEAMTSMEISLPLLGSVPEALPRGPPGDCVRVGSLRLL